MAAGESNGTKWPAQNTRPQPLSRSARKQGCPAVSVVAMRRSAPYVGVMTTKKASRRAPADPVRFAVIGQGHFAQSAILPAFANARACELTALFSDDATKLRALKKKYDVEYALPYDQLSEFLASGAVDAVYIAVPNDLHAAFAESAAGAGVHVLCEKPIAASSAQAERMIAACERGGVKLMIAYRLHFEAANLSAMELVRSGKIGEPRFFSAIFSQQVTPDNTRTKRRARRRSAARRRDLLHQRRPLPVPGRADRGGRAGRHQAGRRRGSARSTSR